MRRIILNCSMNIDGNTARLAKDVFRGLDYTPINLAEHHINQIGQDSGGLIEWENKRHSKFN